MFYDGSASWRTVPVALSGKCVDRLSRSLLGPSIQHTLRVTHSGRLSVPVGVLLSSSCHDTRSSSLSSFASSPPANRNLAERLARFFERNKEKKRKKRREKAAATRSAKRFRERDRERRCGCASVGRYVPGMGMSCEFPSVL